MTDDSRVLTGIWNDLELATGRDLSQLRRRRFKHSILATLLAIVVLGSGVAVAAQQGVLPDIFGAQKHGSDQVIGLQESGRPIDTDDQGESSAYFLLSHAYKGVQPGRVLIDQGQKFKFIGATTERGWLCSTVIYGNRAGGNANCIPRLDRDRPVTTEVGHLPNQQSWVATGLVANGVNSITIETATGTYPAEIENHAYVWFGAPDQIPMSISVQRPDGSRFHHKFSPTEP